MKNSIPQMAGLPVTPLLFKRVAIGAAVGLLLIAVFLLNGAPPNPAWGKAWFVRPLVVVPIAGAAGAFLLHGLDRIRQQQQWNKWLVGAFGVLLYFIVLWMGTILGLAGTFWD